MIRSIAVIAVIAATAAMLGAGCQQPPDDHCELGSSTRALQAADRKLLGAGARYQADGALRGREQELRRSQRARRQVAWATIAKVLAPIELDVALPNTPGMGQPTMPAWQSWYGRDDLNRIFQHLYDELGETRRGQRSAFSDLELDDALEWNLRAVEELPNWPQERWLEYLESIDDADKLAGLGGIAPVGYSPAAARHVLASYPQILACMTAAAPPAFSDSPGAGQRRMLREPIAMQRCATERYGPFFVAGGETLAALLEGDRSAEITVGLADADASCKATLGEPCQAQGPGSFYVSVAAGPHGLKGSLNLDYLEASPTWASCLDGAFPINAVATKAHWRRAQLGTKLPTFDTSAEALTRVLAPGGNAGWGQGDGQADPGAEQIYTLELSNGNRFRLAALHLATKELDHWLWITLWWSPEPDTDFGADRPASIAALGGPWRNYKMCVTSQFDERDPDPSGGFSTEAPSLAAALAATYPGVGEDGTPSWCSNPYLELGDGNAATNCIGCHQHGGIGLSSEAILADGVAFPAHGRTLLRNNFPHDYSFAIEAGDRLGQMIADTVEYYDGFE